MTNINVDIEQADAVAHVTVVRPKVLNALNAATHQRVARCLSRLAG